MPERFAPLVRQGAQEARDFASSLRGQISLLLASGAVAALSGGLSIVLADSSTATILAVTLPLPFAPLLLLFIVFSRHFLRAVLARPFVWRLPRYAARVYGRLTRSSDQQAKLIVQHVERVLPAPIDTPPGNFIANRKVQFLNAGTPILQEFVEVPREDLAVLYVCWARQAFGGIAHLSLMSLSDSYSDWVHAIEALRAAGLELSDDPLPLETFAALDRPDVGWRASGWPKN